MYYYIILRVHMDCTAYMRGCGVDHLDLVNSQFHCSWTTLITSSNFVVMKAVNRIFIKVPSDGSHEIAHLPISL